MSNKSKVDIHYSSTSNNEWRILAVKDGEKIELENQGVLDEVVLQSWFHLEQLDEREWFLRVGDARIIVSAEVDGSTRVDIERGFFVNVNGETKTL